MKSLLCLLTLSIVSYAAGANGKVVYCYFGSWAAYRSGLGKFEPSNINTSLCTHLVYSFMGIDSQGSVVSLDPYLDYPDNWVKDMLRKFLALKKDTPDLKTILAVGGANEGYQKYSQMAADPSLRENFVNTAVQTVMKHGFDGFEFDWEYPQRYDADNYNTLLETLKKELSRRNLLLTISVGAYPILSWYDIPKITRHADLINLMTYNLQGPWERVTGHSSPLHGENELTVDRAVKYWLDEGCPPKKLMLGLNLHGPTYTLSDADSNTPRSPSQGAGISGPYTKIWGSIAYNEVCQLLNNEPWTKHYDTIAEVPYAVQNLNWVSYDNATSLVAKVKYGMKFDLAGASVWSIEADDFHGVCNRQKFPLIRSINRALGRHV